MIRLITLTLMLALCITSRCAYAQEDNSNTAIFEDLANTAQRANSETLNLENSDKDNGSSEAEILSEPLPESFIYEAPTVSKLSQLYWKLGKFSKDDPKMIDHYLFINECDLYKDYFHNEFEWEKIRAAGERFVYQNRRKFPVRFSYVQPLYLGEYDLKEEKFEVYDEYKIDGIRIFEVQALDLHQMTCDYEGEIEGYPKALTIEISRPLILNDIQVPSGIARAYILEKLEAFKNLPERSQSQTNLYLTRDAYIVMKIKIYAYRGEKTSDYGFNTAKVLGVLEGYDIYSDKELKMLLYSEDLTNRKKITAQEEELKKKYQQRLKQ